MSGRAVCGACVMQYFKSIWRVVWRPLAGPVGQREGPFALRVGRFFLFLGVGDLTRNLLGYKFVK